MDKETIMAGKLDEDSSRISKKLLNTWFCPAVTSDHTFGFELLSSQHKQGNNR